MTAWQQIRRRAGIRAGALFDGLLHGATALARLGPWAWPSVHELEVERDVPYRPSGLSEHTLDIYRPKGPSESLPVIFYIHGGAFASLSKDTHWPIGLLFARQGYVVCNLNYRLAPQHRFPAALDDCCAALAWLRAEGARHGAEPEQVILAGESAGANLAVALALAASYPRPERYAAPLYEGARPLAVVAACGLLQVSDCRRLRPGGQGPSWVAELIEMVDGYLPEGGADESELASELMDPLLVLERAAERGEAPPRPLPPFFVCAGTADPLVEDSRRLVRALGRLGVPCEAHFSDGESHAFHALLWRRQAQRCWGATFDFLARVRAGEVR